MSLSHDLSWHFISVKTSRDGISSTVHHGKDVAFSDLEVEKVSHSSRVTVNTIFWWLPLKHTAPVAQDHRDDPLVAPCRCDGSLRYVHNTCQQAQTDWNFIISFEVPQNLRPVLQKTSEMFTILYNSWWLFLWISGTRNFAICVDSSQSIWISLPSLLKNISSTKAWLSHRRGPVDFNCEPEAWSYW